MQSAECRMIEGFCRSKNLFYMLMATVPRWNFFDNLKWSMSCVFIILIENKSKKFVRTLTEVVA
mgnify:CR=1 FL=1